MDRTTKKIFKYIYHHPAGLNLKHLCNIFPNSSAVNESYAVLEKEKLITFRDGYITLTVKGYDFYYNRRKDLLLKIFKTLISPIAVAVIASLITAKVVSPTNNCRCDVTCDYTNSNNVDDVN